LLPSSLVTLACWRWKSAREDAPLVAWGGGGQWSGVAFHTHGAAFAETVVGRKHFWVAPPHARPGSQA
jgi:hypothetical protein